MPNDYHQVHKQRQQNGQAKQPENKSRIVIEGIDEPPKSPESRGPYDHNTVDQDQIVRDNVNKMFHQGPVKTT